MIMLITGALLFIIGVWAMLSRKDIIRIIIGFTIVDTGIHLIIIAIGYVKGGTAPIIDKAVSSAEASFAGLASLRQVVDPVPSALVLTAIVIGLAVTGLILAFAVRLNKLGKITNIDDYEEQKW
ncbi:MAG: sodium:proton antiporter [Candidatus Cloacimonadaceae bacterium]|nr:sodium:proton antiporter [Candidatus Cloacimonadaceae bacterium]MDP3114346.1 sodium:proton antiporter [Candidatus Cloacimonadaceae bacterium]